MSLRPLAACLATLAIAVHCGAFADDDDDEAINPDRPSVAESSRVVGKGRVQLETGVQWDRLRNSEEHRRTLYTPTLLRIGLGESTELRFETDGRTVEHATEPDTGERSVLAGWADTEIGVKWQMQDQQGSRPALGLLLHAALPSGSRDLRGKGVRPSLRLPMEWELAKGWSLAVMPGVGVDSNDAGARYGYGVLAVELDKEINERMQAIVELAAPQIARADKGGTQLVVDAGLTYAIGKDMQLDAMLVRGLNRRSPDWSVGFGFSIRR